MKSTKLITFGLLTFTIISGCDPNEKKSAESETVENATVENHEKFDLDKVTTPYFEGIESPKEVFKVMNTEGGTYKFIGGSSVEIPQNCFTYLDGSPVSGEIEITLQEYNSIADILLSGISMEYDSAGVTHNFVSAGMFHIGGSKEGQPVKIADNKEIVVNTATNIPDLQDTPCYNFYAMDNEGQWEYETTEKAVLNPDYTEVQKPKKPQKSTPSDLVIETVHSNGEAKESTMLWKYAGMRPDTVNLKKLKRFSSNVTFEKSPESQLSYILIFEDKKTSFSVPVEAVLFGKEYDIELKIFEQKMSRIENDQDALAAVKEGKFIRSIGVRAFGLYNWDKIYDKAAVPIAVNINTCFDLSPSLISLHQISKSANLLVSFSFDEIGSVRYYPDSDNHFIATAPGNKVAVLNSRKFFEALQNTAPNEVVNLKLKALETEISSIEELKTLIDQL